MTSFLIAKWVYNVVLMNLRGKAEVGLPNGRKVVVSKSDEWKDSGEVKTEIVDSI